MTEDNGSERAEAEGAAPIGGAANHRPAQPPSAGDPISDWLFGLPKVVTVSLLLTAAVVAGSVKWIGRDTNHTPAWLWVLWIIFVGPLIVAGLWRGARWLNTQRLLDAELHATERRSDGDEGP